MWVVRGWDPRGRVSRVSPGLGDGETRDRSTGKVKDRSEDPGPVVDSESPGLVLDRPTTVVSPLGECQQ